MITSKQLIAASAKPLILTILHRNESYGYEIIQEATRLSGGKLEWSDGMLYPVLYKMENDGLVKTRWEMSDEGRHRKYYSLTDKGLEELEAEKQEWVSVHNIFADLWDLQPAAT